MRRFSRFGAGLLALVLVLSLFAGCGIVPETDEAAAMESFEGVMSSAEALIDSLDAFEEAYTSEDAQETPAPDASDDTAEAAIDEDGVYTSAEDVALYIHTYGKLPQNFITKTDARALGWEGGSLEGYADGMSIGGDRFGNYEGLLPDAPGREYHECDIDTLGASSRGAKRIVYSNDGLIYYTEDHYESFTLLYGEE